MLLARDGGVSYNAYAHALHSNERLIQCAEVVLLLLFLMHIVVAIRTTRENEDARGPVGYAKKNSKIEKRTLDEKLTPSNRMFLSGAVVLGFILLHLFDFHFEGRWDIDYPKDPAATASAGEKGTNTAEGGSESHEHKERI